MASSKRLGRAQHFIQSPQLRWARDPQLWVEIFVTMNFAILAVDIFIAHSMNRFRVAAEYIPLYFSIATPPLLISVIAMRWILHWRAPWRDIGFLIGWLAVLVGLAGVLFHLNSSFFLHRTIMSLTYAAPFAAPLAYTGLGFLLLVNRMVDSRSKQWAQWVIFLALGGFFGNFVLCLTDHAGNGFYFKTEWIPVVSAAFATGFLLVPLFIKVTCRFLDLCMLVMLAQVVVGLLGFWFHLQANLIEPGHSLFSKFVNGAPPLAPLLFPNLVGLALIGLWALTPHVEESSPGMSWLGALYHWANPRQKSEVAQ